MKIKTITINVKVKIVKFGLNKNIMKKITVVLLAIVLSNNVFSQIGIKAGLNLSNVYGEVRFF